MMMSMGCGTVLLAAVITAGVALQRSFAAVEGYSISESDQLRVLDYIAMDCRRALTVSITNNVLTLTVPSYYDTSGNLVTPTLRSGQSHYGKTFTDGVTTNGTTTVTSATAAFSSGYVGQTISGANIPSGTTVASVASGTSIVMSAAATASGTNRTLSIDGYPISYYQSGSNFMRQVGSSSSSATAIATSVSSFTVTPQDLTSTVSCSITFSPRFTYLPGPGPIAGTTVYCNTFLRNAGARQ